MSNYIDNKRFEELIQLHKSGCRANENELFGLFDMLIDRLMMTYKFKVDKEEAKQECFLLILKVLNNFNRDSGAAFNYFTTVILNNFRLLYTKNKKYEEKLSTYQEMRNGGYNPSSVATDPL